MEHKVAKYSPTEPQIIGLAILLILDVLFFALTSPNQGHASVIVAGATLLIVTIYVACWALVRFVASAFPLPARAERIVTLVLGTPIIYSLLMQSIGQLNIKDVLALVPLAVIAYFYFAYGRSQQATDKVRH